MKIDINAVFFALVGLLYFVILAVSGIELVYIAVLGVLFLAAAAGLYLKKKWGFMLAMILLPIGFVFGAVTLYSSVMFLGFSLQSAFTLLDGSLVVYLLASFFFAYKLLKDRGKYQ